MNPAESAPFTISRKGISLSAILLIGSVAFSQNPKVPPKLPSGFEIGRRTSFDFGPPFDYYEVFIVRPTEKGSLIRRIMLSPPGDKCFSSGEVEQASTTIADSVSALLDGANPCVIPQGALKRELERCKDCLVFSFAEVSMQVQCGNETRIIRSHVLDKDMFDPKPNTPEHTSWTMQLLARLNEGMGPGVMDKPMIPVLQVEKPSSRELDLEIAQEVSAGKYDLLFPGAPHRPSDLYRAAQIPPPSPTVRLLSSEPFQPEEFVAPKYPLLARAAHVEGPVSFRLKVDASGKASTLSFDSGNPILRPAVELAVGNWEFPQDAYDQQIRVTIEFRLNCPSREASKRP